MSHETLYPETTSNSSEIERVSNGLVGVRDYGAPVSEIIMPVLINGGRVDVSGESGVGKTSIIQGLASALERNGISPQIKYYDLALSEQEKRWGPRAGWNEWRWTLFNEIFYHDLGDANIVENPAVGDKAPRNRGLYTNELLYEDARAERGPDTLFLFVVRNYTLEFWAGMLRANVLKARPGEVFPLLERNNVRVEGVKKNTQGARQVQDVFRRSGQLEHMDAIQTEESFKLHDWVEQQALWVPDIEGESRVAKADRVVEEKSKGLIPPPTTDPEIIERMFSGFDEWKDGGREKFAAISGLMTKGANIQALYMLDKTKGLNAVVAHNPVNTDTKVLNVNYGLNGKPHLVSG